VRGRLRSIAGDGGAGFGIDAHRQAVTYTHLKSSPREYFDNYTVRLDQGWLMGDLKRFDKLIFLVSTREIHPV
jgi:hypothetical protein